MCIYVYIDLWCDSAANGCLLKSLSMLVEVETCKFVLWPKSLVHLCKSLILAELDDKTLEKIIIRLVSCVLLIYLLTYLTKHRYLTSFKSSFL